MRSGLTVLALVASTLIGVPDLQAQDARIHGRVLDSRTGEPIAKATVSIRERKIETGTSDNGEFELTGVSPGFAELYVTTVGYALVRQKIEVSASAPIELEISLGPEVLRRTDEVTVTENRLRPLNPQLYPITR